MLMVKKGLRTLAFKIRGQDLTTLRMTERELAESAFKEARPQDIVLMTKFSLSSLLVSRSS